MEEKDNKIRVVLVDNGKGNIDMVNLRKSFDGWRVVHPIKNEDGTWNWFNIITGGSWWKLAVIIFIVLIVIGLAQEYIANLKFCANLMNYMNEQNLIVDNSPLKNFKINFTG